MISKVSQNPEIWRIQVDLPQNPLKYLNSYVILGGERPLIVDTGFNRPECWRALTSGLVDLGVDICHGHADLFLTHLHGDHSGLANRLSALGCTIYMSQDDHDYLQLMLGGEAWPVLEDRFQREGFPEADIIQQRTENQARLYAPEAVFPIVPVADGQRLELGGLTFTAIQTPGHTKGHMCLYQPDHQIMFSGDHVLFDITPNITCWLNMPDALGAYLDSLDKIGQYPVKLTLPGHRENEMQFGERLEQIKVHHATRLDHIIKCLKATPRLNAFQIAQQLPWSMRGKGWADFPITAKWFAMGETLSHLDYLCLRGQVLRQEQEGHCLYCL